MKISAFAAPLLLLCASALHAQPSVIFQGNTVRSGVTVNKMVAPSPDPLVITSTSPLPDGDEAQAYSHQLTYTGGLTPVIWALNAGSDPLPPNLNLAGGGESLNDPSFDNASAWGTTVDFPVTGGAAVYTHSGGTGSILQGPGAGAGLAIKLLPGADYKLTYTVSASAGNPVCSVPTIPATASFGLDESVGTHEATFTAHSNPHSFAISCASDSGDDTISFSLLALEQQTQLGTIFGTPTASGDYPFTVRLTDAQPVFATKLLSIHIDPAPPSGGLLFSSDCDDVGNLSAWIATPTGSQCTSTGLIDGNKEITKVTEHEDWMVDNINENEVWGGFDFRRPIGVTIVSNAYRIFEALDSAGNVLFQCGAETDWDIFCKTLGQTTFSGRGFFIGNLTSGSTYTIFWHYIAGTSDNAVFEVRLNGGSVSSFSGGTVEGNIDRVGLFQANTGGTGNFTLDRATIRNDTWPTYTPPVPAGGGSQNCVNQSCAISNFTVPTGSDRALAVACAAQGADRATASVTDSVDGALTSVVAHDANGCHVSIWVKQNPTTGNHPTITAAFPTGSDDVQAACFPVALNGISSVTAQATATDSEASASSISTPITTTTDNAVIIEALCGSLNGNATPGAGQVEFGDSPDPTPTMFGAGSYQLNTGTAGGKTFSWTVAGGPMALTAAGAAFPIVVAINGTPVSSYGVQCDGSDDGPEIAAALNDCTNWTNNTLVFPVAQTCTIGTKVQNNGCSGVTIEGRGSTLKAADGLPTAAGTGLGFFTLNNWDNYTINNLKGDGNRANRTPAETGSADSHRCGHCTNGTYRNFDWANGTNDNVRVHATTPSNWATHSHDLTFIDSKFSNAYRNDVSIIEGYRIRFEGTCTPGTGGSYFAADATCSCQFTGALGTAPQAGFAEEPNPNSSFLPGVDSNGTDGCLIADNGGSGFYFTQAGRNTYHRNGINRNNGVAANVGSSAFMAGGAFKADGFGAQIEGNHIGAQNKTAYGVVNFTFCKNSSLSAASQIGSPNQDCEVKNNFIDGVPPIGTSTGGRYVVAFPGTQSGGVREFLTNAMTTNIGVSASGDWCRPASVSSTMSVLGNTVGGILQSPNPGCP